MRNGRENFGRPESTVIPGFNPAGAFCGRRPTALRGLVGSKTEPEKI